MAPREYELAASRDGALLRLAEAAQDGEFVYLVVAGRRVAALVPADLAEAVERAEDAADLAAADAATAAIDAGEPTVPAEPAWAELGLGRRSPR